MLSFSVFRARAGALLMLMLMLMLPGCNQSLEDVNLKARVSTAAVTSAADWGARANEAQAALHQGFFVAGNYYADNNSGDLKFNYWWQAHGLDALLDGYERTRSDDYLTKIRQLQQGAKEKNGNTYYNEFYDDMEWQALACLRAFELTGDQTYKTIATDLWEDIKGGWSDQFGGGIAWKKSQRDYKNTPANAPAAILAARLFLLDRSNTDYLYWAERIYTWQKNNLVDPNTGLVWDGLNRLGDGRIDKDWRFTYCQGVYIGAGLELYRATGRSGYLDDATRTANFVLNDREMSPNGILRDENGGDSGLFKGILVRYLALLATEPAVNSTARTNYVNFLRANGEAGLEQLAPAGPPGLFNTSWTSPPAGSVQSSTQMSGVMLMELLARLEKQLAGPTAIPSNLYLTGSGTEAGTTLSAAIAFKRLSDGVFELYSRLGPGDVKLVNQTSGTPTAYYINGNTVTEGSAATSPTSTAKVYRIVINFNSGAATLTEIESVGLWIATANRVTANLPYQGRGIWRVDNTPIVFSQETWGRDERYKFLLAEKSTSGASFRRYLGSTNADNQRATSSSPLSYFYLVPGPDNQFDQTFKFQTEADRRNVDITVKLQPTEPYTHQVTLR
jgi:predicted alpha-1,6-mannanase (GH76 family)